MVRRRRAWALAFALIAGCRSGSEEQRSGPTTEAAASGSSAHSSSAPEPPARRLSDGLRPESRPFATDGVGLCVARESTLRCLGDDANPSLLDGVTFDAPVAGVTMDVAQVCAWTIEGRARCWLRLPTDRLDESPWTEREVEGAIHSIRCEHFVTCARWLDSSLHCWRPVPNGPFESLYEIERGVSVYASGLSTCAIVDGGLLCLGSNAAGEISHGCDARICPPTPIREIASPVDVAVASFTSCALSSLGSVSCWGGVQATETGVADALATRTPVHPEAIALEGMPEGIVDIEADEDLLCGRTSDGELFCVQLTLDPIEDAVSMWPRPTRVAEHVDHVAVGAGVVCVTRDGSTSIECFGPGDALGAAPHRQLVSRTPPPGRVLGAIDGP